MTGPTQPTGVAKTGDAAHPLAVTKDDLAALTEEQRQAIAVRKNANIVTAKLAETNWGKGMDDATRRAVGDWGARNGIDVTTEIHVLGGNIYLNAQFYQNRLVGLIHRGHVLDYKQELIQHDARLDTIVGEPIDPKLPADLKAIAEADRAEAFGEIRRRRRLRIEHGAPETIPAGAGSGGFAVGLTTITLAAMPNTPIRGVKWAPHDEKDPIGKAYPQETALTRSARRALKQCVTHIPELARWVDGSEDDAAQTVAVALREYQTLVERRERAALSAGAEPGTKAVGVADYTAGAHKEDVTRIRGPVSVTPAPAEAEASGDAVDHGAESLEARLGPDLGHDADDEVDDLDLMDDDDRREYQERQRRAAAAK